MLELIGAQDFWLTRLVFQRALAAVYVLAFLIALNQAPALIGERGLLPFPSYLRRLRPKDAPSLLWLRPTDGALKAAAGLGLALGLFALSGGSEKLGLGVSLVTWLLLWALYQSFVNVGQIFYGFGWETLLLETGFLAIFLGSEDVAPPLTIIWLLRWLLFRVMFGAGLIKIRGDPCWRDLTCMNYHYETQPLPNPLSWFFHHLPQWEHKLEVAVTHCIELPLPFLYFAPQPYCALAGLVTALFQGTLILSGNLSWLNYITIVLCISCLPPVAPPGPLAVLPWYHVGVIGVVTALILLLSIRPALNLVSSSQLMNASFERLHLVNTYGAFGSVTRVRHEIVLEGTNDDPEDPDAAWRPYEFKGKPGDVRRRPCIVSPYHYKLDWQMWFAAMQPYWQNAWLVHLIAKLLEGDRATAALLARVPFEDGPPRHIRADLYVYRFTRSRNGGAWWERELVDVYLPPLSLDHPGLRAALREKGWLT